MDAAQRSRIESLYIEMHDKLFTCAYGNLKDIELAEEIVQDTFAIACQRPMDICKSSNPHGWLYVAMELTLSNSIRSRMRTKAALERFLLVQKRPYTDPAEMASPMALYGSFAQSEDFKLLVDLAIHMKSYAQMARERGISNAACRKRVQRAKEKFIKYFGE